MIEVTFDIEDLSLLLRTRAKEHQPSAVALVEEAPPEDLSLSVIVDPQVYEEADPSVQLHDTLTNKSQALFLSDEGYHLKYRVAVLGIGKQVEEVYLKLQSLMNDDLDLHVGDLNLWARYQIALFGGVPRGEVAKADASQLADRLIQYRPNYLILVNVGQVKEKFSGKTPHQLALITHRINTGAAYSGQRPYTLVFITDSLIPDRIFSQYWRLCQTMNTFPASTQFTPADLPLLVEHSRAELRTYTQLYLQIKYLGGEPGSSPPGSSPSGSSPPGSSPSSAPPQSSPLPEKAK